MDWVQVIVSLKKQAHEKRYGNPYAHSLGPSADDIITAKVLDAIADSLKAGIEADRTDQKKH